jgi:hypothetical protein
VFAGQAAGAPRWGAAAAAVSRTVAVLDACRPRSTSG